MSWEFAPLRKHYYRAIVADPPWAFKSFTLLSKENAKTRRDAEKHYGVMTTGDIARLPVAKLAHKDGCHLFLWTTGPFLQQAWWVMHMWGFNYSTIAFTWAKLKKNRALPAAENDFHVGLGHTTRKNAEFVLLGRRGNPHRNERDVRELIIAPVREHSRKPDEMFERVRAYCDGPRVELFARQPHRGFAAWGDQAEPVKKLIRRQRRQLHK